MIQKIRAFLDAADKTPDASEYREYLLDMINACAGYVQCVTSMEGFRFFGDAKGSEYRETVSQLDLNRTHTHNDMIVKVNVVNRSCEQLSVEPLYTGSEQRAEYGDFALALVNDIFTERVK